MRTSSKGARPCGTPSLWAFHRGSGMTLWVPVRDESAVVNGLRSYCWWVAAGSRFRMASAPGVRITAADPAPAEVARPVSDFAAVLGESEASYGG
ncbi:hypothetical protein [Streptomyces sp. NPDC007905]|uniref:hypothetical protein n=1 Tax=Streptomyces sp. NPDC007905 TaxID=3364788 RepID=UPI0036EF3B4B